MVTLVAIPSSVHFVSDMASRAWQDTWHLLSPRVSSIAIGLGLNLFAIILYAISKKGFGTGVADKVHFFLMVLGANILAVMLIFLINFGRSPYLLYRDKESQLSESHERETDALNKKATAERQRDETIKLHAHCVVKQNNCPVVSAPQCPQQQPVQACASSVPPQVPGMLEGPLPSPMFLSTKYLAARNIVIAVDGFLSLTDVRSDNSKCSIKITAPKENQSIASALFEVAGLCGCHLDLSVGDDLQPEIEEAALNGATPNFVTIHAAKDKRYERFIGRLGGFFHLKRKYDEANEGKPNQMMWIQIGPGSPWQEKNTYGSTFGSGL